MKALVRAYLAEIGRKGGTRSRRTLTAEQARAMVAKREANRAPRRFERLGDDWHLRDAPGYDIVRDGLTDIANGRESVNSLLVAIAAPKLRFLGIEVPPQQKGAEERLFDLLELEHGDAAHGRYNAWIRRMVSFSRAVAVAKRAHAGTR